MTGISSLRSTRCGSGPPQNWAALVVYVAVMLPVAHVVARMDAARATARRQEKEIRELFQLSDLLVEERPLDELLSAIVTTLADVFGSPYVALFLARDGRLEIAASAGEPLSEQELRPVLPAPAATSREPSCKATRRWDTASPGPAARPPGDKPRAGADPAGAGKDMPRVGAGSAHARAQTVPPRSVRNRSDFPHLPPGTPPRVTKVAPAYRLQLN